MKFLNTGSSSWGFLPGIDHQKGFRGNGKLFQCTKPTRSSRCQTPKTRRKNHPFGPFLTGTTKQVGGLWFPACSLKEIQTSDPFLTAMWIIYYYQRWRGQVMFRNQEWEARKRSSPNINSTGYFPLFVNSCLYIFWWFSSQLQSTFAGCRRGSGSSKR